MLEKPACFGKPVVGAPCSNCGVRAACFEAQAHAHFYVLPSPRPVLRVASVSRRTGVTVRGK